MTNNTIADFYKDKATANHQSYNKKWFYNILAYDDRYRIVSGFLEKYLSDHDTLNVLDVACGTGIYERMLNEEIKNKHHFTGFDISGPHIEINLNDNIFNEMVEGDLTSGLPFDNESYDVIILSEIVEHLWEPEKIINECHRCLKKGGIIIFSTPNLSSIQNRLSFLIFGKSGEIDYEKNFQHIRFFSKKSIDKILSKFGRKNLVYQRGVGSLFFYPHNFPFYIPFPRFMQIIFSYVFPNLGLGFFKVYKK